MPPSHIPLPPATPREASRGPFYSLCLLRRARIFGPRVLPGGFPRRAFYSWPMLKLSASLLLMFLLVPVVQIITPTPPKHTIKPGRGRA